MSNQRPRASDGGGAPRPVRPLGSLARSTLDALEQVVNGLGTAVLALVALLWLVVCLVTCVVGVGWFLVPGALRAVRAVADRERARLGRSGRPLIGAPALPPGPWAALRQATVRREIAWAALHGTVGTALGFIGLTLPLSAVRDATFVLWWYLLPPADATPSIPLWTVDSFGGAVGVSLLGFAWAAAAVGLAPVLARLQSWPGLHLLAPSRGTDLALRVAQLTATRAGALDAHAAELRRIERSLHDGTQNRIVSVTLMLGAARRALDRDPAGVAELLDRAQSAAEDALVELRAVARSILPPVLDEKSLGDALAGLAATCPVPCRVEADAAVRCAASVEATAYFVVAEALTNVTRHSAALHARVVVSQREGRLVVSVTDDGVGGARVGDGTAGAGGHVSSGLDGIRRRVAAHDGTLVLVSPSGGPTRLEVSLPCGS